jgi:hypothetical protein
MSAAGNKETWIGLTAEEVIDLVATIKPRIAHDRDETLFGIEGPRLKPSGICPFDREGQPPAQGVVWSDGFMLVGVDLWAMLLANFGPGPRP